MIRFNKVNIGRKETIASVQLERLDAPNVYALIGKNGSGKSTFLKTISGQLKPISGSIEIDNKPLDEYKRMELARHISLVPSKFDEIEYMTVFDFVSLGRTPYLNQFGTLSNQDIEIIEKSMNLTSIQHLKSKFLSELSDGERQLCAVAKALAQNTPIILLDEPTAFLDYRNKQKLISLLLDLSQKMNLLILFSTHDIELMKSIDIQLIGIKRKDNKNEIGFIDRQLPFETTIEHIYD